NGFGKQVDEAGDPAPAHSADYHVRERGADYEPYKQARNDTDRSRAEEGDCGQHSDANGSHRILSDADRPSGARETVEEHIAPGQPSTGNTIDLWRRALLSRKRSGGNRLDGNHPLSPVAYPGETPFEAPTAGALAQRVSDNEKDQSHAGGTSDRYRR